MKLRRASHGLVQGATTLLLLACRGSASPIAPVGDDDDVCRDDSECQDELVCNGEELCRVGHCVAGAAPRCDDGNRCTLDGCNEAEGCVHLPNPARSCTALDAAIGDASLADAGVFTADAAPDAETSVRSPPTDEARPPDIVCTSSADAITANSNAALEIYRGVRCVGDVSIGPEVTDLSALGDVRRAAKLSFFAPGSSLAQLRSLERIDGTLELSAPEDPQTVALPALRWLGGDLRIGHALAQGSSFPQLRYIGGSLVLTQTSDAPSAALLLPALNTVGGSIELTGSQSAGPALHVPALVRVGGAIALGSSLQTDLALEALREAGSILLVRSQRADAVSLPALERVGQLHVLGNPLLSALRLPKLDDASEVDIRLNPRLSRCNVNQIVQRVYASLTLPAQVCCNQGCDSCSGEGCAVAGGPNAGQSTTLTGPLPYLRLPVASYTSVERADKLEFRSVSGQPLPALALREVKSLSLQYIADWSSLAGLSALRSVDTLTIQNVALTSLAGLEHVEHIDNLSISGCSELRDISAFEPAHSALRTLSGNATIINNVNVPPCQLDRVRQSFEGLTDGSVTLLGNGSCSDAGL